MRLFKVRLSWFIWICFHPASLLFHVLICDKCVRVIIKMSSVNLCVCMCTCVCACLYMYSICEPQQTRLPLCAEDCKRKVQPHPPVAPPTNLVVTVPFIPPIGHGALWQSHVFAHWERQFLANFNRTVAHKKGRATCTGGGANPAHLFYSPPRLSCLWMCCPWTGPCRIWWSCWMLNVPWAASCSECEREKKIYIYMYIFFLFCF